MDYEPFDSSGTDDDLPPTHQNRMSRGGHLARNGRPAVVGPAPYSRMYTERETDMETEIHRLEQEAYSSVLRAFKAQADAITWEKESLITELRKELRLSNEEHRELLSRVNADDLIRRIREWRQPGGLQSAKSTSQAGHDPTPSPTVSASCKKQKITQSMPHQSFGRPSPSFHPQPMAASNPPSSSAAKRGSIMGPKGKKHKSLPSSGSIGRGHVANRNSSGGLANEAVEAPTLDLLIGKKVKTKWPDDNNFYEAVITDYDPAQGRHALVYDMGSVNETWEWVNLSEISPEDIQWEGDNPGVPPRGGSGGSVHGMSRTLGRDSFPGAGRGRGILKGQSRKDFSPFQNGFGKKATDIRILHTDTLIKEVERVYGSSNPDPLEIDKAKKSLKEQEQALIDAIGRLAYISDDESDEGGRQVLHRQ